LRSPRQGFSNSASPGWGNLREGLGVGTVGEGEVLGLGLSVALLPPDDSSNAVTNRSRLARLKPLIAARSPVKGLVFKVS
jgi:hypothetical protein